jgi:hypothetical protein
LERFHVLVLHGLHSLTARWRDHVPPGAELLPTLAPVESLIVRDVQPAQDRITTDLLQIVHPYLPVTNARCALDALVGSGVFERAEPEIRPEVYRYTARTLRQMQTTEQALLTCAASIHTLNSEQTNRLSTLTTALMDGLGYGSLPVPTPIFELTRPALTPSEWPLGQVQQRLIGLLAYRDDAHIAAWRAEGYTAPAIRLATQLADTGEMIPHNRFLQSPIFYDETYLRAGMDELLKADEVIETDRGYTLNLQGRSRRKRVEQLTNEYFAVPFEKRLSDQGLREWESLVWILIEARRTLPLRQF